LGGGGRGKKKKKKRKRKKKKESLGLEFAKFAKKIPLRSLRDKERFARSR
jgi:hypothetical protein